jgi:ADP-ribose pyrophosphatase
VSSRIAHRGRILELEVRTYRDNTGREWEREIIHHPGAVVILPVLEDDQIVLIRNDRVAVGERLWELPAGTLEPSEPPEATAARELEEEAGYRAGRLDRLGSFFTSPGFVTERIHVFVAQALTRTAQRLEAGEDIEVEVVPVEAVFAMIADGRLCDAKSIATVLMWDHARRRDAAGTDHA